MIYSFFWSLFSPIRSAGWLVELLSGSAGFLSMMVTMLTLAGNATIFFAIRRRDGYSRQIQRTLILSAAAALLFGIVFAFFLRILFGVYREAVIAPTVVAVWGYGIALAYLLIRGSLAARIQSDSAKMSRGFVGGNPMSDMYSYARSYRTARTVFTVLEVFGWIVVVSGVVAAIAGIAIAANSRGYEAPAILFSGLFSGLVLALLGLIAVAFVQVGRANVDSAESNAEMLRMARESASSSKQT